MSVKLMSMVYSAHFQDITFIHKGKKKDTGAEYEKKIKVLNSNLKWVCISLADHANDEGEGSYPSVDTLVSKTELSEVTVIACLQGMKREGIIFYVGRSKWSTCNYTINKGKLSEMAAWERQKREKPGKSKTKATLALELKPLYSKTKATLDKPSMHQDKPSIIINQEALKLFTNQLGKIHSEREIIRWNTIYEAAGKERAIELIKWAFKKEIHLTNRPGLLDSLETAAKNWKEKPAHTKQPATDRKSILQKVARNARN